MKFPDTVTLGHAAVYPARPIPRLHEIPAKQARNRAPIERFAGEEWRNVADCPRYSISSFGRIIGPRGLMKPYKTKAGYHYATLSKDGAPYRIFNHRLVAMAFVPNPECKPFVNHKNGIKTDNRPDNLEWVTAKENTRHAFRIGLMKTPIGIKNPAASLDYDDITKIKAMHRDGFPLKRIARLLELDPTAVRNAALGKTYKDYDAQFGDRLIRVSDSEVSKRYFYCTEEEHADLCAMLARRRANNSGNPVRPASKPKTLRGRKGKQNRSVDL